MLNKIHVSDNALRDFAYRVLMSEYDNLKFANPGTSKAEISFFVNQLTPDQLNEIYFMFFNTGMVQ